MKNYSDSDPYRTSFPLSSRPSIQWNHIDGPLLIFRDGQLHWLSLWEKLQLRFGWTDAEKLERKHRPNLMRILDL